MLNAFPNHINVYFRINHKQNHTNVIRLKQYNHIYWNW